MLAALKSFLQDLAGGAPELLPFEASDHRLAAAALLVHIASVDGEFDANERARIQKIVETRFGLDAAQSRELIDAAHESERDAVDLYRFTSVLKRHLDEDGRRQIVAMLWDMAHADGAVHEFEENVVWRVAELIGVSTRDRMTLRREVREGAATPIDNPWSPKEQE